MTDASSQARPTTMSRQRLAALKSVKHPNRKNIRPPEPSSLPLIPLPRLVGGVLRFLGHEWEEYKRKITGLPPFTARQPGKLELVSVKTAARELDVSTQTIKRRIHAARRAAAANLENV